MKNIQLKFGIVLIALAILALIFAFGGMAQKAMAAAQFFGTDFEQVDTTGINTEYVDTSCTDHALANNTNQPIVTQANTNDGTGATELGFSSFYTDCAGTSTGLNDGGLGDGVGVAEQSQVASIGISPDPMTGLGNTSTRAYFLEDTDGRVTVTMQTVSCSVSGSITVSADYYVRSTGYETLDLMRIWVEIDGAQTDLLNASTDNAGGSNMEAFFDLGSGVEGAWTTVSAGPIPGDEATVRFFGYLDNGLEEIAIDNIQIDCGGPTAVSLQGVSAYSTTSSPMIWLALAGLLLAVGTVFVWRSKKA